MIVSAPAWKGQYLPAGQRFPTVNPPVRIGGRRVGLGRLAGNQPGCGLFDGGVFKGQCWCLDYPSLCSADQYKAAVATVYPELVISPLSQPPVVGAPSGSALTLPPASGSDASSTIDDLLSAQMSQWQTDNSAVLADTAANFTGITPPSTVPGGLPWWVIPAAIGIGVLVLVKR